jgi:putative ABC transport system permease protein
MRIEDLVVIKGPQIRDSSYKTNKVLFRDELVRFAFVEKISSTGSVPGEGFTHNYDADGVTGSDPQKGDERKSYSISEVDEHYFDTYHIPILRGSDFSSSDADKSYKGDRLILNETAARQMGYDPLTAVGRVLHWNKAYTIVGIAKDYNHQSLKEKIEPIIYIPQHNNNFYTLKISPGRLTDKLALIQTLFSKMYPGNPFEYTVLKDTYDHLYQDDQRSADIALSLSMLVVAISCLGLIGLSVFTARRRKKEIGIRKVLGAGVGTLFALLSGEFIGLVIIAFLLAVPVTWLCMNKWLEGFAYRASIPWWIFGLTGAAAVFIALATVSVQSLRSAIVNPINSLRSE